MNFEGEDPMMRFMQLLRKHRWVVTLFAVCIPYIFLIRAILSTWTRQEPTKAGTLRLIPPYVPAEAMVDIVTESVVEAPQETPQQRSGENGVCPTVYAQESVSYLTGNARKVPSNQQLFDCAAVIAKAGTPNGVMERCTPQETPTPDHYLQALSSGCDGFKHLRGYYTIKEQLTEEEQFPIAFILLTDGKLEQTERLLRAIYRPHNVYCVYYSVLTPQVVREALETLSSCFTNIFLPQEDSSLKGYASPLEGDLVCMRALLQWSANWKYLLNLQSRQFPLRTNLELVRILKAYKGGNDVDSQPGAFVDLNEDGTTPHGLILSKGSFGVAASRDFINFIVHSNVSRDLLGWMREKGVPEDYFYSTLNHNPVKAVPGAFYGKMQKKSLVQVQISENEEHICAGFGREEMCTFGLPDLYHLSHVPQLFAHKLYLELSPLSFTCLEQWHRNRSATNQVGSEFNQELYDRVSWALYHV